MLSGRTTVFRGLFDNRNINNAVNRLTNVMNGGGGDVVDTAYVPNLTFALYADQILTLDLEGSIDNVTYVVLDTLVTTASRWYTQYDLVPPKGGATYTVATPFLRIRITNASGANTTAFYLWARFTN